MILTSTDKYELKASLAFKVLTEITFYKSRHGVTTEVKRTVSGDLMMLEMEVKGVTATAVFKRKLS